MVWGSAEHRYQPIDGGSLDDDPEEASLSLRNANDVDDDGGAARRLRPWLALVVLSAACVSAATFSLKQKAAPPFSSSTSSWRGADGEVGAARSSSSMISSLWSSRRANNGAARGRASSLSTGVVGGLPVLSPAPSPYPSGAPTPRPTSVPSPAPSPAP